MKKIKVNAMFEKVWFDHWDIPRYHMSGHAREIARLYTKHISPAIGDANIHTLTPNKVRQWHEKVSSSPVTCNRALEVLSKLCSEAVANDYALSNPCLYVKAFVEKKRSRFATEEEIKSIGALLDYYLPKQQAAATFLYAMIYSGARPRSLERAKWSDITYASPTMGLLTFQGKSTEATGDNEQVLIPVKILKMMNALPRRKDNLIFGIKLPRHLWDKIRVEANCPDLYARDLRRTFATVGMSNKVDMNIISELLNHKSTQTTKVYAKLDDSARVKAAEEISSKMDELLGRLK